MPETIIAAVERNVAKSDIEDAVDRIVANEPVCMRIPFAHWLAVRGRPNSVRFDVDTWLERKIDPDVEEQLDAFVEMGFLSKKPLPDHDARWAEYDWTPEGRKVYSGMAGFPRGSFCPPAERRLVEIVSIKHDKRRNPTALRVHFSHTADDYPHWMRTDAVRKRYASRIPPPGISYSTVYLYRIWINGKHPEKNAPRSGMLDQHCYDFVHNRREHCDIDLKQAREP
jgi:hypothetical protein